MLGCLKNALNYNATQQYEIRHKDKTGERTHSPTLYLELTNELTINVQQTLTADNMLLNSGQAEVVSYAF